MLFLTTPLQARIANRLKLLSLFRIGYKQRVLDTVFKIPVIENNEGLIYHLGVGEPFLLEVFKTLFDAKKFVFLDAGVNFGQTLLKIKGVAPNAPYIGFEPSGLCSYYVSVLIKANKLKNARLIRCALSDKPGVLTLFAESEGDTRATIITDSFPENQISSSELVPVVTLDSLIPIVTDSGNDIILKVDVEGAEWMVFKGATEFITSYRPVVIFENLPEAGNASKAEDQVSIGSYFISNSYNLYLLDEENHRIEKLEGISNKSNYTTTNYIAIPVEKTGDFPKLFAAEKKKVQPA